jgi:aminoglycoside phosphotransferase
MRTRALPRGSVAALRDALARLAPALADAPIELHQDLGDTWAVERPRTARIGDGHVVKFGWTEDGAARVVEQGRILRALAHAGLPTPEVVATTGEPALVLYRRIDGVPLDLWSHPLARGDVRPLARSIAGVLAAFHAPETRAALAAAAVVLPAPRPQATPDALRARAVPLLEVAQRDWVAEACRAVEAVLAPAADAVVLHGDVHGWNLVANPSRTAVVGVVDVDDIALGDLHFDLRYVPALAPSLDLFRATTSAYAALTGRDVDRERALAWHVLTDLGDALWRTEAGVEVVAGPIGARVTALRERLRAAGVGWA